MTTQTKRGSDRSRRPRHSIVYSVDIFRSGLAFGQHKLPSSEDPRKHYNLRIRDDSEVVRLRSRYILHKKNPLHELERHLYRLSEQGTLRDAVIYLGTTTDPFFPFEGKFDASMRFLELFQRYTPGMLYVQTRSPLIVIAMPIFKKLGKHCAVTVGVETNQEEVVERYSPGLPRVTERLKTAQALRRFGIETNIQVAPVLPYGDWREDAPAFAKTLVEHADHLFIQSITDGSDSSERRIRATTLAKKLAEDRKFHWLRPDTANPLLNAIQELAPEKLERKERTHLSNKQVEMFAA